MLDLFLKESTLLQKSTDYKIAESNEIKKILICGDRNWKDFASILNVEKRLIKAYGRIKIIEGGCSGADLFSKEAAIILGIPYSEYKAHWSKYGKIAGPMRNQQMLDEEHPNMVIAFHSDIKNSRGTKDMIRRARKIKIPCYIFK